MSFNSLVPVTQAGPKLSHAVASHDMIVALVRQYVACAGSDAAKPTALTIKTCTGYVLHEVARPADVQELCERAPHSFVVSRCVKLCQARW